MSFLRVISDVHGCINTIHPRKNVCYLDLIEDCKYSVQLGDMGFNYSGLRGIGTNHLFIPGNHDNYDNLPMQSLGSYGMRYIGSESNRWSFFFVRGEWSIDIRQRQQYDLVTGSKTWWQEEELSREQMQLCYEEYIKAQPDVVMSHTCPIGISSKVGSPGVWKYFGWDEPVISNTQLLLQEMFDTWQPKLWIFGHFHRDWFHTNNSTDFICIDELNYLDFDSDWRII